VRSKSSVGQEVPQKIHASEQFGSTHRKFHLPKNQIDLVASTAQCGDFSLRRIINAICSFLLTFGFSELIRTRSHLMSMAQELIVLLLTQGAEYKAQLSNCAFYKMTGK
jgi:hypothetical protein